MKEVKSVGEKSRYHEEALELCRKEKADGAMILVLGGKRGGGLATTVTNHEMTPEVLGELLIGIGTSMKEKAPAGFTVSVEDKEES